MLDTTIRWVVHQVLLVLLIENDVVCQCGAEYDEEWEHYLSGEGLHVPIEVIDEYLQAFELEEVEVILIQECIKEFQSLPLVFFLEDPVDAEGLHADRVGVPSLIMLWQLAHPFDEQ